MGSILREKLPTMINGLQTPQKAVNNHAFSFLIVIFLDELTFRRRWLLTFFRLLCSRYHACCLLLLLFVHSGDTGYRLGLVFTYFLCSFFTSQFVYSAPHLKTTYFKVHDRFSYKETFSPKQMYIQNVNQGPLFSP